MKKLTTQICALTLILIFHSNTCFAARFSAGPGAVGITNTTATIMWSTCEPTRTVLEYRTADASLPPEEQIDGQLINSDLLDDHSMVISGLPQATTFYYRVKATDAAGNELVSSEKAFKTSSGPDVTPPQVGLPVVEQIKSTNATISWNVDELSDSVLEYGTQSGVYPLNVVDIGVGNRTKTLTNLTATTLYYFRVQATDTSGNGPTITAEQSFTTLDTGDITPPVIDEATINVKKDHGSATITWETDEFSNSVVDYGLTPSFGQTVTVDTDVKEHSVRLVALTASTTYYFRVGSTDGDDNGPTYSTVKSFTTLVAPDETPPEFDSPPTVNVNDTTATITWTTNEDSHSSVQYGTQSSTWDNYPNSKDDIILKFVHSVTLTELSPNTAYLYRIGIIDGANNGPTVSAEYGFLTENTPDTSPPQFESPPTVTGTTDTTAVIEWSTDEKSTSLVRYGDSGPYADWGSYPESLNDAALVRNHLVTLTNLSPDTLYSIRVGSVDGLDNEPTLSQEITFRTDKEAVMDGRPRVTMPPTVTGIANTSVVIEWQTDEPANGEIRFGVSDSDWGNYPYVVVDNRKDTVHRVVMTNLDPETRYYFRVGATDSSGNGPNTDPTETNNPFSQESFNTMADPDVSAPRIISGPVVSAVDAISATITWATNEPSNSLIQYGTSGNTWTTLTSSKSNGNMAKRHRVTLTNLSPTTTYFFAVGSQDKEGNGPLVNGNSTNPSAVLSFITTATIDMAAPAISNMEMTFATDTTALITWTTDEPANSQAQYGLSTGEWSNYDSSESDADMKTEHSITITNLQPGTQYYFRIASTDAKGNGPTYNSNASNPSTQGQFTTHVFPDTEAPQISGDVNITVNEGERTAVVTWVTPDEPGNSQVQYDTTSQNWGGYALSENAAELDRFHSVVLTNLEVNTIYYVRVSSVDASGNNNNSQLDDRNPSQEYDFIIPIPIIPPDIPTNVEPNNEAVITYGTDVTLQTSSYHDPDGDDQTQTIWEVRRTDTGDFIDAEYPFTDSGLTSHTITAHLDEGLKYDWKAAYVDSDGSSSWSKVYSFKVGTLVSETLPEVQAGQSMEDFRMISIVHWPNDPDPQAVFSIDYNPVNCRIGTYNAENGRYTEFGDGLEMEPGRAYWILTREDLIVNFQGVPVSNTHDMEVCLHVNADTGLGWNQIAPPNNFEYIWKRVKVGRFVEGLPELTVSPVKLSESEAVPLIDTRIWQWERGAYTANRPQDGLKLEPYKGYWVKALKSGVYLVFPVDGRVAGLSTPKTTMLALKSKMLKWLKGLLPSTSEAIADNDTPPMPMGGLDGKVEPIFEGCFIKSL